MFNWVKKERKKCILLACDIKTKSNYFNSTHTSNTSLHNLPPPCSIAWAHCGKNKQATLTVIIVTYWDFVCVSVFKRVCDRPSVPVHLQHHSIPVCVCVSVHLCESACMSVCSYTKWPIASVSHTLLSITPASHYSCRTPACHVIKGKVINDQQAKSHISQVATYLFIIFHL